MKQSSSLGDASSYSRIVRCVFFLLFFSIFFVTTTNAQVMHRRLWPWPTWPRGPRPFPMIQPRPWPMDPPEPAPSPNPCPPQPAPCPPPSPKPQLNPPPTPSPCPPPGPEPCPPPEPEPCPPPAPKPQPKPPAPEPQPKPHPTPDDPCPPNPYPCPPKPPAPGPKPMPPPGPKPPRPEYKDISAVFFFGDSIFDTGNNNNRRKAEMKSNFRPYGINFKDGVATGRFSNGKVSSDYLAKYLGVKKIVKAYLDKKMDPEDLLTGVSFASGGAGYLPKTSKATKAIPMLEQLSNFQDYVEKVNKLVNEDNLSGVEKSNKIISRGVAFVSGGGNDLINTYFGNGAQRLKKDIDAFTTMMADSAASFVLQLYEYGAKRIGVVGLPPLGCVPSQRRKRKKKCKDKLNYASQLFNSKLVIILGQLSKTLQNSTLVYMDVYTTVSQMIETPKDYGFEEIKKSCCKTGSLFSKGVLCKKSTSKICSNTSSYLFWDGVHPTQRALKTINKVLVKEYLPLFIKK